MSTKLTFLKNNAIDPVFFGFNIASLSGVAGAEVIFTGLGRGDRAGLPLDGFAGFIGRLAGTREFSMKTYLKLFFSMLNQLKHSSLTQAILTTT